MDSQHRFQYISRAVVLNIFTPSTTSENICLSKYHHNVKIQGVDSSGYHQRGAQVPPVVHIPQVENHCLKPFTIAPSVLQPIILLLLDITPMLPVLEGVVMELQDCALPLLRGNHGADQVKIQQTA